MQPDPPTTAIAPATLTELATSTPEDDKKRNRFKNEDGTWQKLALLSVFDKTGIVEFAQGLIALGWKILSSGGTAKVLREAGIDVTDVAEITNRPAVLGHRVVTLAPEIHGGLLAESAQLKELENLGWPHIGLVCVDAYPLKTEIAKPGATTASVIEKTDIGGPTMLRSGAKGRRIVVCDPADRATVLDWLKRLSSVRIGTASLLEEEEDEWWKFHEWLCAKAEGHVADYCLTSARYHSDGKIDGLVGTHVMECKYGENPYWASALYALDTDDELAIHRFRQEAGTAPSYINITDVDRALRTLLQVAAGFEVNTGEVPKIAIAVKHGNACGVGVDAKANEAIKKMIAGDPTSIHGASVITNFQITETHAETLRSHLMEGGAKRMIDVVIARSFDEAAETVLERKAGKCRVISNPRLATVTKADLPKVIIRPVRDGFLKQWGEPFILDFNDPRMDKQGSFDRQHELDLVLAWAIGSTSNSNTITLVKDGMLVANAVGQQSRVRAAKLALMIADDSKHDVRGCVAYSDSFFPFPDGPKILLDAGIKTIFASSGSINDAAVLEVARQNDGNLARMPDKICRGFGVH